MTLLRQMQLDAYNTTIGGRPTDVWANELAADFAAMSELFGFLSFEEFARGYAAMDEWFATHPVPTSLPRAS